MTIKIESLLFCVRGRPSTKSMLMSVHGCVDIGSSMYRLALDALSLEV